ncbi:MAG: Ig-like domain-containing protein, partial [Oscillospiraceae bacterium]|nr:Ig-like domain-containing protein [Oscillospiraceae bacterium]
MKVKHYKVTNKKRFGVAIGVAVAAGVAVYFAFFAKPKLALDSQVYDVTNLQGAVVTPDYTGKEVLQFTSGDESIFTIDEQGSITAVGNGEAALTVRDDKHDVQATATVRSTIVVTGIDAGKDLTLTEGDKVALKPGVTPDNAKDTALTYSASSDVVKVDENGNITAVKEGKAVITVTHEASGIEAKVQVTVKAKPVAQTTTTTTTGNNAKLTYIDGILIANKTYALPSSYAPGAQKVATDAFA